MKLERWHTALGILAMLSAGGYGVYTHFAKASDIVQLAGRLDQVDERLLQQRQEQLDTLRLQREERGLPANPQWIKERQKQLEREQCLYRQRFDNRVRCAQ